MKKKEISLDNFIHAIKSTKGEVKANLLCDDGVVIEGTFFEGNLSKIPFIYKPCVYLLREVGSSKFYIGSSNNAYNRLLAHRSTMASGENKNPTLQKTLSVFLQRTEDLTILMSLIGLS